MSINGCTFLTTYKITDGKCRTNSQNGLYCTLSCPKFIAVFIWRKCLKLCQVLASTNAKVPQNTQVKHSPDIHKALFMSTWGFTMEYLFFFPVFWKKNSTNFTIDTQYIHGWDRANHTLRTSCRFWGFAFFALLNTTKIHCWQNVKILFKCPLCSGFRQINVLWKPVTVYKT